MKITFLSDSGDLLNSTAMDLQGWGASLYDITTQQESANSAQFWSTTTISDPRGEAVAIWERDVRGQHNKDRITSRGVTLTMADWLKKKHMFSRTRTLVGPDGVKYEWRQSARPEATTWKLKHRDTQKTIAKARSTSAGWGPSSDNGKTTLVVKPDGVPFMELIILSFLVLEEIRREEGTAITPTTNAAWLASLPLGTNIPAMVAMTGGRRS